MIESSRQREKLRKNKKERRDPGPFWREGNEFSNQPIGQSFISHKRINQ